MSHEWNPRWPSGKIADAKKQIEKWMKVHHVAFDATVYTRDEWEKRGEKYGDMAVITIAAEGSFSDMMNYPDSYDVKKQEKFRAFIDGLGLFMEQGYSWTFHFYPTDESKPALGTSESRHPATLFSILGEIAYFRPRLVLMKGSDYFRVEELLAAARKLVHSDTPQAILIHRTPNFAWDEDTRNKIVIWQEGTRGRRAVYVEPGSEVVA